MKVRPVLQQLTWDDSQSHLDKYEHLLQKLHFIMNLSRFCSLVTLFLILNALRRNVYKTSYVSFLQNPFLAWREKRHSNATSQKYLYAISNERLLYVTFLKLVLVFVKITSSKISYKLILSDKKQVSFIWFITVRVAKVVHEYFLTNAYLNSS